MHSKYLPPLIVMTIGIGLYLDVTFPSWGQTATNIWVWSLFGFLLWRSSKLDRYSLLLCLGFATLGEFVLSVVWGLYSYRLPGIPLFVFPGHCLLFTLGVFIASRLPKQIIYIVPILAFPYMVFSALTGFDTEAIPWYIAFLLCLSFGPAKKLYATMFLLALAMELYGTWMGNWTWAPIVPGLGLTSSNPPACAGVFYCLLDLIVTGIISKKKHLDTGSAMPEGNSKPGALHS